MGFETKQPVQTAASVLEILLMAAILGGMAWISAWNYLLFHSIAELFSVIVAAAIFLIAWNVRDTIENGYLLFLGIAFLFIGAIDLFHMLAFEGMGVFKGYTANLPTQLWIAGRGLESITLLIATAFFTRRVMPFPTFSVYAAVSILILLSVFLWRIFPTCYVEGRGLTEFKILAEYAICLILGLAIARLLVNRRRFPRQVLLWLFCSMLATILSELAFTRYVSVYGDFNAAGHLLKVVSVILIYKAIVQTGFRRPYELMYRNLAESERKFRSVVESNVIGVVFADPATGAVSEANDEYLRIIGRSRAELQAGSINWKSITPAGALPAEEAALAEPIKNRKPYEKVYVRPDGTAVPVIIAGAFQEQAQHRIVAFVLDNTARKQAEDALREAKDRAETMAAELARSNRELEQFGYIASHDLQEPLRTISGFLGLLRERYAANLDDKAKHYISFAVDGANRMARLITDLLEYSRTGREKREFEPVDTNAVFKEAQANCSASIQDGKATVTSKNLPAVMGNQRELVQLFQNLIGNSVKFRRNDIPACVEVSAARDGGHWIFSVRDNGIGIPADQIERLFVPFKRLHRRDEYGGTGIGLALCRKIVELHGGRIWIESEYGDGTNVSFTLKAVAGSQ